MDAAAAGWSSNSAKLARQSGPRSVARTLCTVRAGDLRGQRRLEDGQRLAELERPALELAQDPEDLLGGALLDFLRDDLGRSPAQALAEPERGAADQAHRQGRQLGGARDGSARQVTRRVADGRVSHMPIVGYPAGSPRRPQPQAG